MKDRTLIGLDCLLMIQHAVILLMLGPMLPEIMSTFNLGESTAGLILSAGALGSTLGPLFAGLSIDRKGLKFAILTGLFSEVILLSIFGTAPFFWLAAVMNFLLISAAGFIEVSVNVIPAVVKNKNTVSVMNLVHFFFSIGAFISPMLIGLFIAGGGWWQNVIIGAAVPTLILALFFTFIRFSRHSRQSAAVGKFQSSKLLSNRAVILGALTLFFYVGGELGFSSWIVHYLEKKLLFGKMQAAFGMSLFWIGIMSGRLSNTFLAHKFSSVILMTAASILSIICGAIFIFISSMPAAYILIFLIGLAMAGGYPITMAEINRKFPGQTGAVSGILTFGAGCGAMLFQWLIGFTAEHSGLQAAMSIPFLLMFLVIIIFRQAVTDK